MSTIQELSEKINAYPARIREAKEKKRITSDTLIELTGVAPSAVHRLLAGSQSDPKLYNSAAICKALDLSLDELFGLDKPADTPEGLQARIHELELENANLRGEIDKLAAVGEVQSSVAASRRTANFLLLILATALSLVVAGYLWFDHSVQTAGLIRYGELSAAAWAMIAVVIAAIVLALRVLIQMVKETH